MSGSINPAPPGSVRTQLRAAAGREHIRTAPTAAQKAAPGGSNKGTEGELRI